MHYAPLTKFRPVATVAVGACIFYQCPDLILKSYWQTLSFEGAFKIRGASSQQFFNNESYLSYIACSQLLVYLILCVRACVCVCVRVCVSQWPSYLMK